MLRLRPSELTVTSDDVEETFRRIAQKQASRVRTNRIPRVPATAGGLVLRRGPQRYTRDAITALADIPTLIPHPQQAILTSVGGSTTRDPETEQTTSIDLTEDVGESNQPTPDGQSAPTLTVASPARRSLHLPFRLARTRPKTSTQPTPDTQVEDAPYSPRAVVASRLASFIDQSATPARSLRSSDSPAELRGGGRSSEHRAHVGLNDSSPLQQMKRTDSSRQKESPPKLITLSESSDEELPVLYLQGYFIESRLRKGENPYSFVELDPPKLPRTEPRQGSTRQGTLKRSLSTGSVPFFSLPTQQTHLLGSLTDDVFGTVPHTDPSTRRNRNTSSYHMPSSGRSRQMSSEISHTSMPYSYYGSYGSQRSSRSHHSQDQVFPYRYDGSAGSRQASWAAGAAYQSPYQTLYQHPGLSAMSGAPIPSMTSGDSSYPIQQSLPSTRQGRSPLPSHPYTRVPGNTTQGAQQLSSGIVSGDRHYVDAATAAVRGLRSPLDDYAEQYQPMLPTQQARTTTYIRPNPYQTQFQDTDAIQAHQNPFMPQYNTMHSTHIPRASGTHDPYRQMLRNPGHPSNVAFQDSQIRAGRGHGPRTDQRSSENVPVNTTTVQGHLMSPRSTGSAPSRFSAPQTGHPRDTSNRPRTQGPHQAISRFPPSQSSNEYSSSSMPPIGLWRTSQDPLQTAAPARLPGMQPRIPTRTGSRQHSGENPTYLAHPRSYRPGPPTAPPSLHLHPTRDQPLTSLALSHGSGVTSRRSRSPLMHGPTTARTHRRVPAQQRNQENSIDTEMNPLRLEEAAINSRYADDQQQDVMDETPPRIGRVERRMLE